ncbi:MAG: A/G-specific adenine glycosylase [Thermodesulfobacteriota bacterium]
MLAWYRSSQRDLPWRRTTSSYRIWVSEVMLQQTQVDTVIPYYERFIRAFPSVRTLARASLQDVLGQWEGLGYYARARNLHKAAGIVLREHKGKVPGEERAFRGLPGVGEYTASAVMSIAFGHPLPVVDGNVARVLSRLFCLDGSLKREVHRLAGRVLATGDPGTWNQAMMELGATVCLPRTPLCSACPVSGLCGAYKNGKTGAYPVASVQRRPRHEVAAVGLIHDRRGRILISRRPEKGLLGGLWEFPGGKVQQRESPSEAVVREVREELGIDIRVDRELCRVKHAYSHFRVTLHAFDCVRLRGRPRALGCVEWRWIRSSELKLFPFPRANRKILELLETANRSE